MTTAPGRSLNINTHVQVGLSLIMSPTLPQIKSSNAAHLTSYAMPISKNGSSTPVAVFIGGTSGVGEGMARAFAKYTKGNASIIIVGRNREAGERILSELEKSTEDKITRLFVQCDVSLMRNVVATAQQLTSVLSKINYLVISTGFLDIADRTETKEGLEYRLSITYYSRWLFLRELAPLLDVAINKNGERAVAMSILATGYADEIDPEDWELKKNYSTLKTMYCASTYNDLMVESFAERYPSIPFIHAHPGMVRTPIFRRSPSVMVKIAGLIIFTLARPFTISAAESADWMWWTLLEVEEKSGSFRMDQHGKELGKDEKYYGGEEKKKGLFDHTESAVSRSLCAQI